MIIPSSKGLIALDIDGTVTAETHIPVQMVEYLHSLVKERWVIAFITGRPFDWACRILETIPFSALLAIQNGALLLELPSNKIINRHYLDALLLPNFEAICKKNNTDFVVYTGFENNNKCYYRSLIFPPRILNYILDRANEFKENWIEVASFDQIPVENFSSFKCFLNETEANFLSQEIESQLGLHCPPIKDPFCEGHYIVQATHPLACKAQVVQNICKITGFKGPIIAAGNDKNDFGMLEVATVKVVMADAPANLLAIADIIAPPAVEMGLIQGLEQALNLCKV